MTILITVLVTSVVWGLLIITWKIINLYPEYDEFILEMRMQLNKKDKRWKKEAYFNIRNQMENELHQFDKRLATRQERSTAMIKTANLAMMLYHKILN